MRSIMPKALLMACLLMCFTAVLAGKPKPRYLHSRDLSSFISSDNQFAGVQRQARALFTRAIDPLPKDYGVTLSNGSVQVGPAINENLGRDFMEVLFSKLQALCTDTQCSTTEVAEIDDIATASTTGVQTWGKLQFRFAEHAIFEDVPTRDSILALAVTTFELAAAQNCKEVDWCPTGRSRSKRTSQCHNTVKICAGPAYFSVTHDDTSGRSYLGVDATWIRKDEATPQSDTGFSCTSTIRTYPADISGLAAYLVSEHNGTYIPPANLTFSCVSHV